VEEVLESHKEALSNKNLVELEEQCEEEGEEKLQAVYSLSCKRLVEILHHIPLALGIADDDDPDTEHSSKVA
jgi:hypothetical protein